jgi:ABC-type branched-subunit amino acid transport system ATPase component
VVGLIGPNGAGKTSAIDAITGFTPATGSVTLGAEAVQGLKPHARVHRGLGRTFQSLELYDDLTVEENVSVAAVALPFAERMTGVDEALDLVGIQALRDRSAGELSQGERQLVSIARAVASRPAVILLDEPAAGLGPTETTWLGERIRALADAGVGILLVDHDVGLVMGVCDHVHVLDFGRTIAAGTPQEVRADPMVAAAYLGEIHDGSEVPT